MLESTCIETSLGSWNQTAWIPPPGDVLHAAVDRIWDFEGRLSCARERVFPDGLLEIVVQLDEPHRPPGGAPFPALVATGLRIATESVEAPPGRCRVLGIRLRPLGAAAVLRTSMRELTGRSIALDALAGDGAATLGERLDAARTGEERVRLAYRWVRDRLADRAPADPLVGRALAAIERDGGAGALRELAELGGRSRSRFAARFRDDVGLSPKRYARVVRFRSALRRLAASEDSVASIAAAAGYYDQAHLATEFRAHAGLTPLAYRHALRYPGSDHLAEIG